MDYKLFAVKYYLNHEDGYDNTCKIFDWKNLHLKDGYKDIRILKILQGEIENQYLIK